MFRSTPKFEFEDPSSCPYAAYAAFVRNEDLFEKLKILDYDKEFVVDLNKKCLFR